MAILLIYGTACVLLAVDAEAIEEDVVSPQPGVHTRGSRVARHDRLRYFRVLEAANSTSNFDPNLDPNRPQQRPTQADILQEAVAEISRPDGALSNIDLPPGSLRALDV